MKTDELYNRLKRDFIEGITDYDCGQDARPAQIPA